MFYAASTSSKRRRGPSRGKELQRINESNKTLLEVCIDPIQGRPLDKVQSAKLSSEIGIVSWEFQLCPVSFPKFKEDERNLAYDQIRVCLIAIQKSFTIHQLFIV